ncbi:hypothetical protein J2Z48_002781 [Croceifilum oryzae]|uniref:Uncharacterized protein n=1 Tax=Croceifilum oryzae TaxID=1553429 RepID=A0AAJ1TGR9_9BACL|nr:hypothetical protein [Croceifilum oryzae]MDQ0418578.1 hypothetical protein [Croceifilum oryzae]
MYIRRILKRFFSILLAVVVFALPSINVNASSAEVLSKSDQQAVVGLLNKAKDYEIDIKSDKQYFVIQVENLIKLNNIELHVPESFIVANSKLYKKLIDGTNVLTVNIQKDGFHEASNISFFFDKNNNVVDYAEFHLKKSKVNTFQIAAYVNGKLQAEEVTDTPFVTAKEYQKSKAGGIKTKGWSEFLDCMNIPGNIATRLALLCGGVCVVTAGTGCVVCVAGVLGIHGGAITACLSSSF